MAKFDAKSFNEKAFGKYMSAVPNVKLNKLRESRAVVGDARLRDTFVNNSQTGTVYAVLPFFGLLSGTPQNYDGVDNVTPGKTDTYEQGVFTYGRMNGWTEADFSYDITGGTDFMANVRNQINDYWNSVDQDVILAILKGIFECLQLVQVQSRLLTQHLLKHILLTLAQVVQMQRRMKPCA